MSWDIHSANQGEAPISATGWNHLHLVIAGRRMKVLINHLPEATLAVTTLEADGGGSGMGLKGSAAYANLVVQRGSALDLGDLQEPAPAPGTVINWLVAALTLVPAGREPEPASMPPAGAWKAITAEPSGLVDLGRAFGPASTPSVSTAWLGFTVAADKAGRHFLDLDGTGHMVAFLNGKPVYREDSFYYPPGHRLSANGRLERDNATIPLDLAKGENRVVLAVNNDWHTSAGFAKRSPFGWGAEAHLRDRADLSLR